jgi:phosphoglycerate dehydrogenase-like enzyme
MTTPQVAVQAWLPDGMLDRWRAEFPGCEFVDAQDPAALDRCLGTADIVYGLPPVERLPAAGRLRWIQLISAGVPQELCPAADRQGITVTNLAGLYGASIAEHAVALMVMLARNLHRAVRQQQERRWDRDLGRGITDLQGKTLAVVGLGSIGRGIARLGRAYGMRVLGCRRTDRPAADVDRVYPLRELRALLAEADHVAVALPWTRHTDGLLGAAEFAALKPGAVYVNVSRGGVAREPALLDALRTGRVAAAGLDVFAEEPLPPDHPLWTMPQVVITPHYAGEVINTSSRPAERFARNLRAWLNGQELEGRVDLEWGY